MAVPAPWRQKAAMKISIQSTATWDLELLADSSRQMGPSFPGRETPPFPADRVLVKYRGGQGTLQSPCSPQLQQSSSHSSPKRDTCLPWRALTSCISPTNPRAPSLFCCHRHLLTPAARKTRRFAGVQKGYPPINILSYRKLIEPPPTSVRQAGSSQEAWRHCQLPWALLNLEPSEYFHYLFKIKC
jgi:hypothetical protein